MLDLPEPVDDGLIIPDVGPQSLAKHHFLRRYIDAFTTAMKGKKWDGLHYIDLFAGAGIEQIESGKLDWGSPLIAAQMKHPFAGLHFCELNKQKCAALAKRLGDFPQPHPPQILNGDANIKVADVVKALPPGSLSVAFLDPYGLHLNFDTLRQLAVRSVDFIIFFPDHVDALRNIDMVYRGNLNSNLDKVLGTTDWRKRTEMIPADKWAEELNRIYQKQIGLLGYTVFEVERISSSVGRFLYKLIFCSRSDVGGKIWRGTSDRKPDDQFPLF